MKLRWAGEGVGSGGHQPGREDICLSTSVPCVPVLSPLPPTPQNSASVKFSVLASKGGKQRLRRGARGLRVSIFWLVCRTANKKVIYSQATARSEVSRPTPGRGGPPSWSEGLLACICVFGGASAQEDCRELTGCFVSLGGVPTDLFVPGVTLVLCACFTQVLPDSGP